MKASLPKRLIGIILSLSLCLLLLAETAAVSAKITVRSENLRKIFSKENVSSEILDSKEIQEIQNEILVKLGIKISIVPDDEHVSGDQDTIILSETAVSEYLPETLSDLFEKAVAGSLSKQDVSSAIVNIIDKSFDTLRNDDAETANNLKETVVSFIETSSPDIISFPNDEQNTGISDIFSSLNFSESSFNIALILLSMITLAVIFMLVIIFSKTRSFGLWLGTAALFVSFVLLGIFVFRTSILESLPALSAHASLIAAVANSVAQNVLDLFAYASIIFAAAAFVFYAIHVISRPVKGPGGKEREISHDKTALKITYKK